jgi:hypothetical protein
LTEQVQEQTAAVPDVPQQQFQVPPAGPAARVPNGTPIAGASQQPGWLPQGQPQQNDQQQAQAQAPDLNNVVAMLQAAIAGGKANATAVQPGHVNPDSVRPTWMQTSANSFDVSAVDDPIIRSMATVMQTVGKNLDLDRVLGRALAYGDTSLIDNAYLHEAGGEHAQELAEIAKGIVQAVGAKADAVTASVYAEVGGEAAWNSSVAAFNHSAPQELRITVSQMLDSTNAAFIKAGAKIVAEFGKGTGLIPQASPLLGSTAAPAMFGQGLTKVQFQAELGKIRPDTPGYEEARDNLFARRTAGKRAGL